MPASPPEAQRLANAAYYSSKGKEIYSDFSTFAQGKALATCNAIEFVRDFADYSHIDICEYGVGNGNFAKVFLDEVKKRDAKLYSRTHYFLFDLSEKMLHSAKQTLELHKSACTFSKFDAAYDTPSQEFDYCRINELLTDLPAEIYMVEGGKIISPDLKHTTSDLFVAKFLQRVGVGRAIPFNFAAQHFLLNLCKIGRQNFCIDLFDYGFYSADDIFIHPREEWNSLMVREYGSQITVDLNFPQMLSSLAFEGIPAKVEMQKDYAERVLGCKLELSESDDCLDYVKAKPSNTDIVEDDDFYHLRIGRQTA